MASVAIDRPDAMAAVACKAVAVAAAGCGGRREPAAANPQADRASAGWYPVAWAGVRAGIPRSWRVVNLDTDRAACLRSRPPHAVPGLGPGAAVPGFPGVPRGVAEPRILTTPRVAGLDLAMADGQNEWIRQAASRRVQLPQRTPGHHRRRPHLHTAEPVAIRGPPGPPRQPPGRTQRRQTPNGQSEPPRISTSRLTGSK